MPQPIMVTDGDSMAAYGKTYAILVVCPCGHRREVYNTLAVWKIGPKATIGQFRERLRCTKCRARMPRVEIYRRQRD